MHNSVVSCNFVCFFFIATCKQSSRFFSLFSPPTSGQGSWWRWSHVCGRKFLHCFGVRPAPYWWFWARHWSADHVPHRQQQHQGDAAFMSVSYLLGWIKPGFISTGYFWYFTSYDQLLHTHTLLMHTYKHMLHTHTLHIHTAHTHTLHTHRVYMSIALSPGGAAVPSHEARWAASGGQ